MGSNDDSPKPKLPKVSSEDAGDWADVVPDLEPPPPSEPPSRPTSGLGPRSGKRPTSSPRPKSGLSPSPSDGSRPHSAPGVGSLEDEVFRATTPAEDDEWKQSSLRTADAPSLDPAFHEHVGAPSGLETVQEGFLQRLGTLEPEPEVKKVKTWPLLLVGAILLAFAVLLAGIFIQPESTPEVGVGKVAIESDPSGAKIFVENRLLPQKTPYTYEAAGGSRLRIRVELANHVVEPKHHDIELGPDSNLTAFFVLTPLIRLQVTTNPAGAMVTMNGSRVEGETPLFVSVERGTKPRFVAEASGYVPRSASVEVTEPGQTLALTLAPAAKLSLLSEPLGAEVFRLQEDAEPLRLGATPLRDLDMPIGVPIRLRFTKSGYISVLRRLVLSEKGKVERVRLKQKSLQSLVKTPEDRQEARRLQMRLKAAHTELRKMRSSFRSAERRFERIVSDPYSGTAARAKVQSDVFAAETKIRVAENALFEAEQAVETFRESLQQPPRP